MGRVANWAVENGPNVNKDQGTIRTSIADAKYMIRPHRCSRNLVSKFLKIFKNQTRQSDCPTDLRTKRYTGDPYPDHKNRDQSKVDMLGLNYTIDIELLNGIRIS